MDRNLPQMAKQIEDLKKLKHEMPDAVFDKRYQQIKTLESQQIQQYQLQQNKIRDEAKYLDDSDIQRIYIGKGGNEAIIFARDIITGEAMKETGLNESLSDRFYDFIKGDVQSQVVFVCEKSHWLTVRLEKVNGGITYQVADSIDHNVPEHEKEKIALEQQMKALEQELVDFEKENRDDDGFLTLKESFMLDYNMRHGNLKNAVESLQNIISSTPEKQIDALMNYEGITKIPFESEKQQNRYDCGIFCALNAVDMSGGQAQSTKTQKDVDTIRANFENKKVAQPTILPQQKKVRDEGNIIDGIKNKLEQGNITIEQAIKSIEFIKGRVENTLNHTLGQNNASSQAKYIERLLKRIDDIDELHTKISQQKPQQTSRLSNAPQTNSYEPSDALNKVYTNKQTSRIQSQSNNSQRNNSNILIRELPELKTLKPAIHNINKSPKSFNIV